MTVPAVELAALAADRAALADLTNRIRQLEEGTTMTRNRSGSSPSRSSVARTGTAPGGNATGATPARRRAETRSVRYDGPPPGVPIAPVVRTTLTGRLVVLCPLCGRHHYHENMQKMGPHRAPGCGIVRDGDDRVTGYWLQLGEATSRA